MSIHNAKYSSIADRTRSKTFPQESPALRRLYLAGREEAPTFIDLTLIEDEETLSIIEEEEEPFTQDGSVDIFDTDEDSIDYPRGDSPDIIPEVPLTRCFVACTRPNCYHM